MLRCVWLCAICAAAACAQVTLTGRVVDEHDAPIAGARVSIAAPTLPAVEAITGPAGRFAASLAAPGVYRVSVERSGFFAIAGRPVEIRGSAAEVTLELTPQREVFQSVDVGASPSPLELDQTNREQRLSGTEVNDVPYPASHSLRNAMKLIPGVVQDPSGGIHFHGGAEYQTEYKLNGFDISDPVDGRFTTRLAVEGVRSLDLVSSREGPQYGRGSAGALNIATENGTDRFHYTATNFVPGVQTHGGFGLGDWTPRAAVSGPLKKGRAWFSDTFDGEYNPGYISGLPKGQDTNVFWTAGNLFHTQVNLTPANILYTDLLASVDRADHAGLGVLTPISTTSRQSDRQWMAALKDTYSWSGGSLLEGGFAWFAVHRRTAPQGSGLYLLTPDGRRGNYFVNSDEHGRRAEQFLRYYPPAVERAGRHQFEIGEDYQRLSYDAAFERSGYQVIGLAGLPLFETTFRGPGRFSLPNDTFAAYVNDHWQPHERLTVDAGLRQTWSGLVGRAAPAPRVAAAWAPFARTGTKFNAGYAVIYDSENLALFSRPLDQQAVTVPYSAEGQPGAPLVTTFARGHDLKLPRYGQWTAGVEQRLPRRLYARLDWQRKRGSDGFVYANQDATAGPVNLQPQVLGYGFGGTYALTNLRRDRYDEIGVTIRQALANQYGWMASYVHSRAVSNAVLDVAVDQPLEVQNNFGPVPWDAPDRFLAWGYLPLYGKNWAIAFLVDWRSGFPYSIVDEAGRVVGAVDSRRLPANFDLNVHIERRFTFHGYRFGIRAGFNNITGHRNPAAVNNVVGAPEFGQFLGDEGRHAVIRLRMFGRAK